jgi:hypothetical protein
VSIRGGEMKSIKDLENGIVPSMEWSDQLTARILIEILKELQSIEEILEKNSKAVEEWEE